MLLQRSSGILLHISSLPGAFGIGTMGPEAYDFVRTIKESGLQCWQILPVGPVDGSLGYSPYATTSTFAGNWLLISLEKLCDEKWCGLKQSPHDFGDDHFIDFDKVIAHKLPILRAAFRAFTENADSAELDRYGRFCHNNRFWLDDFALYAAAAGHYGTNDWLRWDMDISLRDKEALKKHRSTLAGEISFHTFVQYIFFKQWLELKDYCADMGIRIIGDIPIYVTLEGADAWSNPQILQLDKNTRQPLFIAGVPPDYFSATGQRWGNPLYKWFRGKGLNRATLEWWVKRIGHLRWLFDYTRIDHFRGFAGYWSIPAHEETAIMGSWEMGPGIKFFRRILKRLGDLPLIAEDLGVITPDVERLRDDLKLPGMKILQFAFDFDNKNYYLPHNINNHNCILYTGTHDNNTTNGWFYGNEINEDARKYVMEYLGIEDISEFSWRLIRQAYRSVANLIIFPAQDILGYDGQYRMNIPGTASGNWIWKLTRGAITEEIKARLRRMGAIYDRIRD